VEQHYVMNGQPQGTENSKLRHFCSLIVKTQQTEDQLQ